MPPIVAPPSRRLAGLALAGLVFALHLALLRPAAPPVLPAGATSRPASHAVQVRQIETPKAPALELSAVAPPAAPPVVRSIARSASVVPAAPPPRARAASPATAGDAESDAAPPPPADAPDALSGHAVRLPPPAHARYRLRRGDSEGDAVWHWWHGAGAYEARLSGRVETGRGFEWSSQGAVSHGRGLDPARFLARQSRQSAQAANFRRDVNRIGFSGAAVDRPLWAGAQDRLTWMVQIAGIVAAEPARFAEAGTGVVVPVVGARGDADLWRFESHGSETLALPSGDRVHSIKLIREPTRPYDLRVEIWLDAQESRLPWRVRLSPTAGPAMELHWLDEQGTAAAAGHPTP